MAFDTEQIRQEEFSAAIQNSYAEYGVSSNARAIPDARDGLKPVQRRILWFMYRMGWDASHDTVKSAEVVGTVMGQAHPHGQEAIYDAAVRLAQKEFDRLCSIRRSETMPPENGRISQRRSMTLLRIASEQSRESSLRGRIAHSASESKCCPAARLQYCASRICRGQSRMRRERAIGARRPEFAAHFAGA